MIFRLSREWLCSSIRTQLQTSRWYSAVRTCNFRHRLQRSDHNPQINEVIFRWGFPLKPKITVLKGIASAINPRELQSKHGLYQSQFLLQSPAMLNLLLKIIYCSLVGDQRNSNNKEKQGQVIYHAVPHAIQSVWEVIYVSNDLRHERIKDKVLIMRAHAVQNFTVIKNNTQSPLLKVR